VLWDTATHWTHGVPNLGGVTFSFSTVTPAEQRIDWSGRRTPSVIHLDGRTRCRFGGGCLGTEIVVLQNSMARHNVLPFGRLAGH
jgi:hypothetical protein